MQPSDWIFNTRAADIMTREIVTFDPLDTMSDVAEQLLDRQITGAPVVNDGHCIGVVSANDLVSAEETVTSDRVEFSRTGFWDAGLTLPVMLYEEQLTAIRARLAPMSQQPVQRFMSTEVVSVQANDSLHDVMQKMIDGHIHRVIVLDDRQKLVGLISTLDVLAALIRAGKSGKSGNHRG